MKHIILAGDSIFDNSAYINNTEPDVAAQVKSVMGKNDRVTLLATDGDVTSGVKTQLERLPEDATHLIISAGGNDALGVIHELTEPANNIGGVSIYAYGGAAKVRGGSGTTTTFGAADPHCQRCGKDFAMEWENEKYGKLSICAWCLSEKFEDIVIEKYEGDN